MPGRSCGSPKPCRSRITRSTRTASPTSTKRCCALCRDTGIAAPHEGATHYAVQSPSGWHLKWERHRILDLHVRRASRHRLFRRSRDRRHSGRVVRAAGRHPLRRGAQRSCCRATPHGSCAATCAAGSTPALVGSNVLGGGKVFCDWHVRDDGFMRFLVVDEDFREEQGGRLQRLYEIGTYRMMALLALPVARRMSRGADEIHAALHALMQRMDASGADGDDTALLVKLTHLAVRVESLSGSGARFSASRAYESSCWHASTSCARGASKACRRSPNSWSAASRRRWKPAAAYGRATSRSRADRAGGPTCCTARRTLPRKGRDALAGGHGAHRAQSASFAALRAVNSRLGGVQGAARDEPAGRSGTGGRLADRAGRVFAVIHITRRTRAAGAIGGCA